MPPSSAATWPSSEVPTPNGMTGASCFGAGLDDRRHLLGRVREGDRVGRIGRVVGFVAAVALQDAGIGADLVGTEQRDQFLD